MAALHGGRVCCDQVREMRMDKDRFIAQEAAGRDWDSNEIVSRDRLNRKNRTEEEKASPALLALYDRADKLPSYALFVISKIHANKADELKDSQVPAIASQLRDMYFVFTDGLQAALERMQQRHSCEASSSSPSTVPGSAHPKATFAWGAVDIRVVSHKALAGPEGYNLSLRDDTAADVKSVRASIEESQAMEGGRANLPREKDISHDALLEASRDLADELACAPRGFNRPIVSLGLPPLAVRIAAARRARALLLPFHALRQDGGARPAI